MFDSTLDWLTDTNLLLFGGAFFALLCVVTEAGFRLGNWSDRRRAHHDRELSGVGSITAGMLGLLAFTLGITINIAQNRFEARRELVVQEANSIGTAWLRAKLVNGEDGPAMVAMIEDYAKTRLEYTAADKTAPEAALIARTNALQNDIWARVQAVAARTPTPITASLIAALNDMFDQTLAQRFAFESRVPPDLSWMLLAGSVLAIGAMGFQLGLSGKRQIVLTTLLLFMWSGGIMLIADLNRPRIGAIRVDPRPLLWTVQGFAPGAPGPQPGLGDARQ